MWWNISKTVNICEVARHCLPYINTITHTSVINFFIQHFFLLSHSILRALLKILKKWKTNQPLPILNAFRVFKLQSARHIKSVSLYFSNSHSMDFNSRLNGQINNFRELDAFDSIYKPDKALFRHIELIFDITDASFHHLQYIQIWLVCTPFNEKRASRMNGLV